ncbi:lachesin [Elysia marginata]|uniref:Lachesin n=1 Tax=Elysia marginata TaxID=1093978 RepID=A0AAV4GGN5_9GAST|nr:lachesin [Elysia marginata]
MASFGSWEHLLFYVILLGFGSIVNCQEADIVEDIIPEVKRVGMTAKLNCTVARMKQGAVVQWIFKNPRGDEILSSGKDIQVVNEIKGGVKDYEILTFKSKTGDRTTYQLVISRLRPEYNGDYECSISMTGVAADKWPRKTGYIRVFQAPTIRPGSTDSVKMLEKGSNSSLVCDAIGVPDPNITWVRSDGKLLPNGKAIFRGRTLPITFADVKFSGLYKCVADNTIKPPAVSLAQVYVAQEPTVRVLQDSVGQFANGQLKAKLDCIVQGYPTPTVEWVVLDGPMRRVLTDSDKFRTTKQVRPQWFQSFGFLFTWVGHRITNVSDCQKTPRRFLRHGIGYVSLRVSKRWVPKHLGVEGSGQTKSLLL